MKFVISIPRVEEIPDLKDKDAAFIIADVQASLEFFGVPQGLLKVESVYEDEAREEAEAEAIQ